MKKTTNKNVIKRLIVCAAALAILIPLGFATGILGSGSVATINFDATVIWKLALMIFCIIAVETLIVFLLSLPKTENHRARSVLSVVSSLMKYLAVIVILCWGLAIIGVNVSTIVASVGIVALVVGFSAESLIADVVTGAFMIFENQYNVGDIVEIDNFRGTVTNIGIRTTCLTDPGGNVKIVNNSSMKNILNRSDKVSRSVSDIAVPYPTDLEKLEENIPQLMQDIFAKHPDVMKAAPMYLGVQALAESSVVLRFAVNVDENDIYTGARVLNHDLLLGFRKLGVECPYPQLDIHTDK